MPDVTVYLGLGSNLGDREGHLGRGLEALGARGVRVTAVSGLYETEPVGGPAQGPYLNLAAAAETALPPEGLLQAALEAEAEAGRVRTVRNAPRTLDVDILFYGDLVRRTGHLTVPHPRLHERRFVLVPLADLAPALRHPGLGRTVAELLASCPDHSRVEVRPGRAVAR
ncbi:MAG TPA: 2-amino-4-hydroxy-6-hydroxymethyldihydropteridine diphosphokinase [Vicinamibacteria bacterium]|nr:2-amino-4-hydroxy-6-hydroxymethyldihydropteridine diphosphokinase [Vicinamibacteria bacterium]